MSSLPEIISQITGAKSAELGDVIQELWSGYGVIQRAELFGLNDQLATTPTSVVVKHIDLSQSRSNRRGWGGDISHQRKVHSYQVEKTFYESFSSRCDEHSKVPKFVAAHELSNELGWVIVLQDLDSIGFSQRRTHVNRNEIQATLNWLANFHATYLGDTGEGLWAVGTYWHLETRPDEFQKMPDGPLKLNAEQINERLNQANYQTLVHGDAKIANFCFSDDSNRVAAVDFQYVGRGCGMKDIAYLVSSCLEEREAAQQQEFLLDYYFRQLELAIKEHKNEVDFDSLETEWRELYPFAWADFYRFLSGWSPGHWKLNSYSQQLTQAAINKLSNSN